LLGDFRAKIKKLKFLKFRFFFNVAFRKFLPHAQHAWMFCASYANFFIEPPPDVTAGRKQKDRKQAEERQRKRKEDLCILLSCDPPPPPPLTYLRREYEN
jgi:hypothetical protein